VIIWAQNISIGDHLGIKNKHLYHLTFLLFFSEAKIQRQHPLSAPTPPFSANTPLSAR